MFSDILQKYSSAATGDGTDKMVTHSYEHVYNEIFDKYKNTCKNILEIGIDGGFGLQSYSEYFINSTVYGIDIRDNINSNIKQNPNIKICIGDACSDEVINHFNIEFDIIVEDASHLPEHQIQHFKDYSKFIKKGGVYIIEDVMEGYLDRVVNEISYHASEFAYKVHDLRHIKNRYDDIMIVYTKI